MPKSTQGAFGAGNLEGLNHISLPDFGNTVIAATLIINIL